MNFSSSGAYKPSKNHGGVAQQTGEWGAYELETSKVYPRPPTGRRAWT